FWDICRLRRGPEDVPYSVQLLVLLVLLDFLVGVGGQLLAQPERLHIALSLTALALAMDAVALWGLLAFKHLKARWVQSLATVVGIDLLLSLVALPLTLLSHVVEPKSFMIGIIVVSQMLLVGWNIGLRGFVLHRALNIGMLQGNMLSLALFMLNVAVSVQIFPELVPAKG
ncbi:MAG TPA: hypothetical protein VFX11_01115, partial [Candidatus Kapabacteria bacterium]|nr:hypothetical protein [Candidatus Kapabacteria bacterium]